MNLASVIVAFVANALWQSTFLIVATWAIFALFRNANATTRYAVWLTALAASLSLPIVTSAITTRAGATIIERSIVGVPSQPARSATIVHVHNDGASAPTAVRNQPVAGAAVPQERYARPRIPVPELAGIAIAMAWAAIAALLLVRLVLSLLHLERLKRDALPLAPELRSKLVHWNRANKGSREVRLCVSSEVVVPTAVGLFDAMILLPEDFIECLDPADLDRILLHELAHLRRRDDWSNAFAQAAFAVLFFSPAVAYAIARLDVEREVACDDSVLAQDAEALVYANTLARMTEIVAWPHRPLPAPGIFMSRRGVSVRIERILEDGRDVRARLVGAPAAFAIAAIAAISLTGAFAPAIALSQTGSTIVTDTQEAEPADILYTATWELKPFRMSERLAQFSKYSSNTGDSGRMMFDLHYSAGFSNWSVPADFRALGIDADRLKGATAPIEFSLVRDAGTFACAGHAGDGIGRGTCRFTPNAGYAAEFEKAGMKLALRDQVVAGMCNLSLDYLHGIVQLGMAPMSFQSLMGLKMMAGSLDQIRALRGDFSSADAQAITTFVMMQDRMPDTHALHEAFPTASIDDVMTMGMAGVTLSFVDSLRKAGVRGLSANNVTALRAAGVDDAFVRRMIAAGKTNLTVDEVVALKNGGF